MFFKKKERKPEVWSLSRKMTEVLERNKKNVEALIKKGKKDFDYCYVDGSFENSILGIPEGSDEGTTKEYEDRVVELLQVRELEKKVSAKVRDRFEEWMTNSKKYEITSKDGDHYYFRIMKTITSEVLQKKTKEYENW